MYWKLDYTKFKLWWNGDYHEIQEFQYELNISVMFTEDRRFGLWKNLRLPDLQLLWRTFLQYFWNKRKKKSLTIGNKGLWIFFSTSRNREMWTGKSQNNLQKGCLSHNGLLIMQLKKTTLLPRVEFYQMLTNISFNKTASLLRYVYIETF